MAKHKDILETLFALPQIITKAVSWLNFFMAFENGSIKDKSDWLSDSSTTW